MANESQYFNPIIQAMAQTVQAQQNQQRLEQEQERQKQEIASSKLQGAQSQQAHDLAERSQKYYEQHSDKLLDLKAAMDKANQQLINAQIGHTMHDMIMHGATPGEVQQIAPGIGQLPTREDVGQFNQGQAAGTAGAVAGAQSRATAPIIEQQKESDFGREQSSLDAQHVNAMELAIQHGKDAQEAARIHARATLSAANINGGYHMAAARLMYGAGANDDQVSKAKQLVDGLFNGNIDPAKLTIDQKRLATQYASGTGELSSLPLEKDYAKKLDTIGGMQELVNTYRGLAQKYSVDSPGRLGTGNLSIPVGKLGAIPVTMPGSELSSELDNVKASGGKLATFYDQQSRKSDAEILRQVAGWFSSNNTMAENQAKIEKQVQQLQPAVKSTFVGMSPDRINTVLAARGATDFGAFEPKQFINKANGHIIEKSPDGKNWIDSQTRQPFQPPPTAPPLPTRLIPPGLQGPPVQ